MNSGAAMPDSRDRLLEGRDGLARQVGQARRSAGRHSRARAGRCGRARSEQVMAASGHSSRPARRRAAPALGSSGEKIAEMRDRLRGPPPSSRRAACAHRRLVEAARTAGRRTRGRPRPSTTPPRTSVGQVLRPVAERRQRGRGRQADAARAATLPRSRRWTTALVKCVVPIITPSMRSRAPSTPARSRGSASASSDAGGHVLAGRRLHRARRPCRPRSGRRRCWCRPRRCRCALMRTPLLKSRS